METWVIGIVVEESTEEIVKGYLKKISIRKNRYMEIEPKIIRVYFELNVVDKTYYIYTGHISTAMEIGRRLQEKGYNDLTLIFNDRRIKISEN